jgi:hypothetical protein
VISIFGLENVAENVENVELSVENVEWVLKNSMLKIDN